MKPERVIATGVVAVALSLVLPEAAAATLPGANGRIAYVRVDYFCNEEGSEFEGCPPEPLDGDPWVITMAPDGTRRRRITSGFEPGFSPDGRRVAFSTFFGATGTIYVKRVTGGRERPLPGTVDLATATDPAWSPSGRALVFASTRRGRLVDDDEYIHTIGTRGRHLRVLARGIEPDWSVTDRIAFGHDDHVYVMDADGGGRRKLARGFKPSWSPDGRWIVFSRPAGGQRLGISLMRSDGSQLHVLTRGPWDGSPVWSPDGRWVAFVRRSRATASERIVVMRPDGSSQRTLVRVRRGQQLSRDHTRLEDLAWQTASGRDRQS